MSIAAKLNTPAITAAPPKRVRAKTLSMKRLAKRDLEQGRLENPEVPVARPRERGDCLPGGINEARPCLFVSCRHHLYLDVLESGSIKVNFPDLEPWEIPRTCALDVADEGAVHGLPLEQIGSLMNMTRENLRKIETSGLRKLREIANLAAHVDEEISRPDLNVPERTLGLDALKAGVQRLAASVGRSETTRPWGEKDSAATMLPEGLIAALRAELAQRSRAELCAATKVSWSTLQRAAAGLAVDRRTMRRLERGLARLRGAL